MQVVVSEFMNASALEAFPDAWQVTYDPALVDDRSRLLALLNDADALIVRNRTQVDAELLARSPALRVVGRLGVGLDNIDMDACAAKGVEVRPAVGANTLSVAEYVVTTAMMLLRGAYRANAAMIDGAWPRNALMGRETSGRTLGLVGYGAIAQAVADRAHALGMNVAATDPYRADSDPAWGNTRPVSLDTLFAEADVLSLHVPLSDETRRMIGAKAIAKMKRGAMVINTARGGIVDEAALAAALKEGALGGAALDVFETEPLTAEAAAIFRDVPNLILTPHIAGVTEEANDRVSAVTVANVMEVLGDG